MSMDQESIEGLSAPSVHVQVRLNLALEHDQRSAEIHSGRHSHAQNTAQPLLGCDRDSMELEPVSS